MPLITACPACHTQFVVKKEQLKAYEGQVRCGTCQHVFNAKTYLIKSARPKKVTVTQVEAVLSDISLSADAPLDEAVTEVLEHADAETLEAELTDEVDANVDSSDEAITEASAGAESTHIEDVSQQETSIEDTSPEDASLEETSQPTTSEVSASDDQHDEASTSEERNAEAALVVEATSADSNTADSSAIDSNSAAPNSTLNTSEFADTEQVMPEHDVDSESASNAALIEHTPAAELTQASADTETAEVSPATAIANTASTAATSNVFDSTAAQDAFHQHLNKRPFSWPLFALCAVLGLVLLGQLLYFMRTEISAHFPPTKPWLSAACQQLGCTVALPRQIDYLTIDDSDMHEHLDYQEVLVFASTLVNHAPYAQAYPTIELTLTNTNDEPVLRRTFTAKDYLPKDVPVEQGIAAKSEVYIKLNLNTADIAVAGYRVALSY